MLPVGQAMKKWANLRQDFPPIYSSSIYSTIKELGHAFVIRVGLKHMYTAGEGIVNRNTEYGKTVSRNAALNKTWSIKSYQNSLSVPNRVSAMKAEQEGNKCLEGFLDSGYP